MDDPLALARDLIKQPAEAVAETGGDAVGNEGEQFQQPDWRVRRQCDLSMSTLPWVRKLGYDFARERSGHDAVEGITSTAQTVGSVTNVRSRYNKTFAELMDNLRGEAGCDPLNGAAGP